MLQIWLLESAPPVCTENLTDEWGITLATLHNPRQNHLLAVLPMSDYKRLLPHLELAPLPLGEVLYESGSQLQHVYFPTTSIVSLLYVMEDGSSAEIAVVGHEERNADDSFIAYHGDLGG